MLRTSHPTRNIKAACLLLVVLTGLLLMPAGIARAATISVNTTTDEMSENSTCSLREAIVAANTNSNAHENNCKAGSNTGTDTITLVSGSTYSLTISGSGEDASQTGDLDIVDNIASTDLIIKASGGNNAAISQDAATDDRVLETLNGTKVQIKKITIQNGHSANYGGGIAAAGWLILDTSAVTNNIADANGGGVFSVNGPLEIKLSIIASNVGVSGGGLLVGGISSATITDSTIADNDAADGGGIYTDSSTVTISDSDVSNNTVTNNGGGIYNENSTLTLNSIIIDDNNAGPQGGGLYNASTTTVQANSLIISNDATNGGGITNLGDLTINGSNIISNFADSAAGSGGGIRNESTGDVLIENGSFIGTFLDGNEAFFGGGIINNGDVTIDNSSVHDNIATADGGGIYNFGSGIVTVQNGASIYRNDAEGSGGGIYSQATTNIHGSEVSSNDAINLGGGIFNASSSAVLNIDTGSEILLNDAATGAGIANEGSVTISGSFISENEATIEGGGAYNSGVTMNVTGSAFLANSAVNNGDAVFNAATLVNAVNVTGSCIQANAATAVHNIAAQSQNFTGNWWGSATGPTNGNNPGGTGDSASANIDYSGFLTSDGGLCVDNLLVNGSFEEDTTPADLLPDDWTPKKIVLGPDGLDNGLFSDGTQSFRFDGNGDGSKLIQEVLVSGNQGDSYTLTFDARRNGVNGGGSATVKVQYFHLDGSKKTYQQKLVNGTDVGFVGYTLNALALKAYDKIVVTVQYTKSAGEVWFDKLLLTQD